MWGTDFLLEQNWNTHLLKAVKKHAKTPFFDLTK